MSTEENIELFGAEFDHLEVDRTTAEDEPRPRNANTFANDDEAANEYEEEEAEEEDKDDLSASDAEVDALFSSVKNKKKKSSAAAAAASNSKSKKSNSGKDKDKEKKKKRPRASEGKEKEKRHRSSRFFLDEASEGEDDDEELDDTAEVRQEELTKEEQEAAERVLRRHKQADELFAKKSEEDIAREFEKRAIADRRLDRHLTLQSARSARGKFIKPAALPDYTDPRIYRLRCKPGEEQVAIRSVLLKAVALRKRDGFSKVKSAFFGNTPGYLYIEAFSETFVKEIVTGLQNIYINRMAQVELKEMTQVLQVQAVKKPFELHQFVRLKRGANKGDLARIIDIINGGESVVLQMVPRVEYHSEETKKQNKLLGIKSDAKVRPPARLFDAEAARAATVNGELLRQSFPTLPDMICDVWNDEYYKDGFLLKQVRADVWVDAHDVKPSLEELRLFQTAKAAAQSNFYEDDDTEKEGVQDHALLEQIAKIEATKLSASPFVVGDFVKVIGGDLMNLVAQVVSVDDKARTAKIVALNQVFKGAIEVELALLIKHITEGVHVKVMSGQYAGQTGRVVSVSSAGKDAVAAILTDGLNMNIQCNVSLLQVSDDVAIGSSNLAGYELYDLVQLSENETAVVVTVGAQKLKVINHMGGVKDVAPQEIRAKLNSMRASAFDSSNTRFVCGDILHVHTGPNAKQSGTVKHINKGTVWLHSNQFPKNSGIFVVKGRNCSIAGSGGKTGASGFGSFGAGVRSSTASSSSSVTGYGSNSSTPLSNYSGRTPQGQHGELRIGSQVKITGGAYRSMLGVVLNIEGNYVFVELSAKMKKVHVTKDQVRLAQRVAESSAPIPSIYSGFQESYVGAETPFLSSQTPRHLGAETPSHFGSETPFTSFDDSWNITERDHDAFALDNAPADTPGATPLSVEDDRRITTPLSALTTPSSVADDSEIQYVENMVVKILEKGSLAVVMKFSRMDDLVTLRLRDGSGILSGEDFTLSTSEVKPMEPSKNAKVKIVGGSMNVGEVGVVMSVIGKNYLVNVDGAKKTFKQSQLIWLNS